MRYYPVFLDLQRRSVVVIGGGRVAARKLARLVAAGAAVEVIAPAIDDGVAARVADGTVRHRARVYRSGDLAGAAFALAATGDRAVNRAVAAEAAERGIPVNVVDDAELSTAVLPAVIDRDPVTIAVGTAGSSPVLARRLRARIEAVLPRRLGALAALAARWRDRVKAAIAVPTARRRFWEAALAGPVADLVEAGRDAEADAALARAVASQSAAATDAVPAPGLVTLVGAGPGAPGLLTLDAFRALQDADVIFHDRLVAPEILALARAEADLVDVGKQAGGHGTAQEAIHARLIAAARRGLRVVRLKGGDPFVFGRGGEELEALRAAGIPYAVVPGVTAALACGAFAGIPLTHRELAQAVTLVTAHCTRHLDRLDFRALAVGDQTLAVYMGVGTLGAFATRLVAAGRAADTPVALIENGSRAEQRVALGRLDRVDRLAAIHGIVSPALLVVGDVARHAATLGWFGAAPLREPSWTARARPVIGEAAPAALYAY